MVSQKTIINYELKSVFSGPYLGLKNLVLRFIYSLYRLPVLSKPDLNKEKF